MPRRPRGETEALAYHVLNRAVRRADLFTAAADYSVFELTLVQALQRVPVRLLAYCAMPNHWHLVLWPRAKGELPRLMHWFTCTHAQRWHAHHKTSGTGPVYQGRYKAIAVRSERQFLSVCRYVERNPLKAGLVDRAEDWRWSSLWRRNNYCDRDMLHEWPTPRPPNWVEHINS